MPLTEFLRTASVYHVTLLTALFWPLLVSRATAKPEKRGFGRIATLNDDRQAWTIPTYVWGLQSVLATMAFMQARCCSAEIVLAELREFVLVGVIGLMSVLVVPAAVLLTFRMSGNFKGDWWPQLSLAPTVTIIGISGIWFALLRTFME